MHILLLTEGFQNDVETAIKALDHRYYGEDCGVLKIREVRLYDLTIGEKHAAKVIQDINDLGGMQNTGWNTKKRIAWKIISSIPKKLWNAVANARPGATKRNWLHYNPDNPILKEVPHRKFHMKILMTLPDNMGGTRPDGTIQEVI